MLTSRTLLTTAIILVLMVIGAVLGIYTNRFYQPAPSPESIPGLLWPDPKQLTEFTTIDQAGNTFGLQDLKGKWSLLFFGYTYCPDVCPLTLSALGQIHNDLQQQFSPGIQTVFVTVDPERDTTTRLAEYIRYFNPDFIALGGSIEQIKTLASQIGIAWSHEPAATDGSYMVNHSSSVFLLDPQARLVGILSAPHEPDELKRRLLAISGFINSQQ